MCQLFVGNNTTATNHMLQVLSLTSVADSSTCNGQQKSAACIFEGLSVTISNSAVPTATTPSNAADAGTEVSY